MKEFIDRVFTRVKLSMHLKVGSVQMIYWYCTSSTHFAPSFVRQPNGPEWTQMVRNALEHHFRVQWVGSGVFVAENSNATTWYELLH